MQLEGMGKKSTLKKYDDFLIDFLDAIRLGNLETCLNHLNDAKEAYDDMLKEMRETASAVPWTEATFLAHRQEVNLMNSKAVKSLRDKQRDDELKTAGRNKSLMLHRSNSNLNDTATSLGSLFSEDSDGPGMTDEELFRQKRDYFLQTR